MVGGRALSNWPEPSEQAVSPSCDSFLTVSNKNKVASLVDSLFGHVPALAVNGPLAEFSYVMLASLLQYQNDVKEAHGSGNHPSQQMLAQAAKQNGITEKELGEWGVAVATRFKLDNAPKASGTDAALINPLRESNIC